ncbi:MAG: ribosome-associated translation inhibitor RaiA [Fibrobacteria bacterium]|nr:ribosome-associated translation inhibitor RaiA [Fibrobacteria bacterium]
MNVQITSRHFKASTDLQDNIKEMVNKLSKFNDSITAVHVILDAAKKNSRQVEIIINVRDKSICVSNEAENMGKATEKAFEKAERQLKKENQKLKEVKLKRASLSKSIELE